MTNRKNKSDIVDLFIFKNVGEQNLDAFKMNSYNYYLFKDKNFVLVAELTLYLKISICFVLVHSIFRYIQLVQMC